MPFIGRRKPSSDSSATPNESEAVKPIQQLSPQSALESSQSANLPPTETIQPVTTPLNETRSVGGKKQFFNLRKPQIPSLSIPGKPQLPSLSISGWKGRENNTTSNRSSFTNPPLDPEKEKRHAARREERRKQEEQWQNEWDDRMKKSTLQGTDFEGLDPLPEFNSDTDEEASPNPNPDSTRNFHNVIPGVEGKPQHDAVVGDGLEETNIPISSKAAAARGLNYEAVAANAVSQYPPTANMSAQAAGSQQAPHHQKLDSVSEARIAEMFAAQAYSGTSGYPPMQATSLQPLNTATNEPVGMRNYPVTASAPGHIDMEASTVPSAENPQPIGWGDVYDVRPEPMFGVPPHLRNRTGIDSRLEEKIYRGRELGRLAIEQEEQGNLGAAEAGYMKALDALVPALKELDIGTDASKEHRMKLKAKIHREASGMVDRCEELKMFLKANTSQVPTVMPTMPTMPTPKAARPRTEKKNNPPTRPLPPPPAPSASLDPHIHPSEGTRSIDTSSDLMPDSLPSVPNVQPSKGKSKERGLPPPPNPPTFDADSSDFLMRMKSRHNVLASASASFMVPRQMGNQSQPPSTKRPELDNVLDDKPPPKAAEKCFMCNAPADLRTKCSHCFCSNCGNQAVSVFGKCPVPKCGTPMSVTDFDHI